MKNPGGASFALAVLLSSTSFLASCTSVSDLPVANLPADLRESANCVAGVLLTAPGITSVAVSARQNQNDVSLGDIPPGDERKEPIAVVTYTFTDENKKKRAVSFAIFKDPRLGSPGIAFDFAIASGFALSSKGGPVTLALGAKFDDQCHAGGFLRT
jgi:hypothetical protein